MFGSRLRDFARYGMLYTSGWEKASDTRIASDSYFKTLHKSADKSIYKKGGHGPRMVKEFGPALIGPHRYHRQPGPLQLLALLRAHLQVFLHVQAVSALLIDEQVCEYWLISKDGFLVERRLFPLFFVFINLAFPF